MSAFRTSRKADAVKAGTVGVWFARSTESNSESPCPLCLVDTLTLKTIHRSKTRSKSALTIGKKSKQKWRATLFYAASWDTKRTLGSTWATA